MQLYTFPDVRGVIQVIFIPNEGHLYSSNKQQPIKCDYSNFSLTKAKSDNCVARPGEKRHNHFEISRDSLEYAILCWGCLIRILNGRGEETVNQSVKICRVDMAPQTLH